MAIDWEAEVGAPNVATFGETARIYPSDGVTAPFDVVGVFDATFRENVIMDSLSYTSDAIPVIGINAAQFGLYAPRQNDKVLLTDPTSLHFGRKFIVKEPRPDSHGIIRLDMNDYSGNLPA